MKKNTYAAGVVLNCDKGHKWVSSASAKTGKCWGVNLTVPIISNPKCPVCRRKFEGFYKFDAKQTVHTP